MKKKMIVTALSRFWSSQKLRGTCPWTPVLAYHALQDLVSDLQSKQREVNELIDEGNQFTDDTNLPEKDRETIHEKMVALHDDWNKLANLTSGKQQTWVSGDWIDFFTFPQKLLDQKDIRKASV